MHDYLAWTVENSMVEEVSRRELVFSVIMLPIAAVLVAVFGYLTIRASPYFVAGMILPMILIGISCAGLRTLKGEAPVNP